MTPQQLFEDNQKFATWMAHRYSNPRSFEDIQQLALIGLYEASKNFDPTKGNKFVTYARFYIHKEIIRGYFQKNLPLKIPRGILEHAEILKKHLNDTNDVNELSELTGLKAEDVTQALTYMELKLQPMDTTINDGVNAMFVSETIAAKEDDWDNTILFKDFVKSLNDSENAIVMMRLDGKSQREISEVLGVSQVQVSRLLVRIKNKFISYTKEGCYT